jgi:uncharacterized protein (TIGR00251 family)
LKERTPHVAVKLQVKPGTRKEGIWRQEDGTLLVKIRERPVEGAANAYLLKFLAEVFGIRKSSVQIVKGFTVTYKTVQLEIDREKFEETIRSLDPL